MNLSSEGLKINSAAAKARWVPRKCGKMDGDASVLRQHDHVLPVARTREARDLLQGLSLPQALGHIGKVPSVERQKREHIRERG